MNHAGPFAMPECRLASTANAERLDQAAEASSAMVSTNIQRATNYVLGVVLFAWRCSSPGSAPSSRPGPAQGVARARRSAVQRDRCMADVWVLP
jgi:hypothetical protein